MTTSDVRTQYAGRLADLQRRAALLSRSDRALAAWRLASAGAAIGVLWLAWAPGVLSAWWALAPAGLFAFLAVRHDRVLRRLDQVTLAAAHYVDGLARIDGTWPGRGRRGERYADAAHPYAADLDLFGCGSVFELLCTAATRPGQDCLAAWLLAPAPPSEAIARQAAVDELRGRADLREAMAVVGGQVADDVDPWALAEWCAAAAGSPPRWMAPAAVAVGAAGVAGLALWLAGQGVVLLGAAAAAGLGLSAAGRPRVRAALEGVEASARGLSGLARALAILEGEAFASPLLHGLRRALVGDSRSASACIGRLGRLVDGLHAAANPFLAPLAALVLWRLHFALAIERWRTAHGAQVPGWLHALGELEALCSLAGYAYERPEQPFATFVTEGPVCDLRGVAHPLLGPSAVPNGVALDAGTRVLLVSGSNMSGKSTLLRAVGVNVVLAQCGAPVRAASVRLSPMRVATAMRLADSLQAGVSHFYAEVTRLKLVTDAAAAGPCLFLLDEILHGTNSHDRLVGAAAVVRTLVARGGVGLVTTHDLALARLADEEALRVVNVHFEDQVAEGRLSFDYALRPGVVERGNALELMRSVGLDV